jgi:hypothetical protein
MGQQGGGMDVGPAEGRRTRSPQRAPRAQRGAGLPPTDVGWRAEGGQGGGDVRVPRATRGQSCCWRWLGRCRLLRHRRPEGPRPKAPAPNGPAPNGPRPERPRPERPPPRRPPPRTPPPPRATGWLRRGTTQLNNPPMRMMNGRSQPAAAEYIFLYVTWLGAHAASQQPGSQQQRPCTQPAASSQRPIARPWVTPAWQARASSVCKP